MEKTTQAFGYIRVSGDGQVDGDGFKRQRAAIEKYADANGVEIVRWFEERGVSGTILDRPALSELMVALMSNGVRMVLIEKLDRIARDVIVQETIVKNIQQRGFTLVSVMEPDLCIDDPSRKLMRQIMGAFAEYDREMIVLKTRAARQRIRKSGVRCEGRKIYGQHKDANVAEQERAVIARILAMAAKGEVYEAIARTLNAEGITARKGSWFGSTVRSVIKRATHGTRRNAA
jgi:DNA invertase Pin-like site-specific DNA recombinase